MGLRDEIRTALRAKGWSQNKLAKAAGLPQATVNRYLAGKRDMTGERIDRLMVVLGLSIKSNQARRQRD